METKNKLAIFDLDGTLFDTTDVNYSAYMKAIEECGLKAQKDYQYFHQYCCGNNYKLFLPQIVPGISAQEMQAIHDRKKRLYKKYLHLARINHHLFNVIDLIYTDYYIALATTASRSNADDILGTFKVEDKFNLIIAQENVRNIKPDPECFEKAMKEFGIQPEDTIIFEDSENGLKAAKLSGAKFVRVYGYN